MSQHMDALARAQEIRLTRGVDRRRIHALPTVEGRHALADLIEAEPEHVAAAVLAGSKGNGVLAWPRMTRNLAPRFAAAVGASEMTRLDALTARQRTELCRALRGDLRGVEHDRDIRQWAATRAA